MHCFFRDKLHVTGGNGYRVEFSTQSLRTLWLIEPPNNPSVKLSRLEIWRPLHLPLFPPNRSLRLNYNVWEREREPLYIVNSDCQLCRLKWPASSQQYQDEEDSRLRWGERKLTRNGIRKCKIEFASLYIILLCDRDSHTKYSVALLLAIFLAKWVPMDSQSNLWMVGLWTQRVCLLDSQRKTPEGMACNYIGLERVWLMLLSGNCDKNIHGIQYICIFHKF